MTTAQTETSPRAPGEYMLMTLPVRASALGLECGDCGEVLILGTFTLVNGLITLGNHAYRKHNGETSDDTESTPPWLAGTAEPVASQVAPHGEDGHP